jgi:hypothetical protein
MKAEFQGTMYIRPLLRGVLLGGVDFEDWLERELQLKASEAYVQGKELQNVKLTLEWEPPQPGVAA